ncbi:hypothetical protein [Pseudomonas koreensis]|uniref:hypothetical protein n=1 Tax=Pseudomonas koreensis TaxID=198620 RepID=UPI001475509A|nr:hypothetical protein [Pseudomonas koreensis]NNA59250.1 hypothetical protein [Pseudomonas koreensis]
MTVFLLLYLCADASRTDCQVFPTQQWMGDTAYEQCLAAVPSLTKALTATNRTRHRFVCEIQTDDAKPAEEARPRFIHQSFRM